MSRQVGTLQEWHDLTWMCIQYLGMSKLDIYTTLSVELEFYLSKFVQMKKEEAKNMKRG